MILYFFGLVFLQMDEGRRFSFYDLYVDRIWPLFATFISDGDGFEAKTGIFLWFRCLFVVNWRFMNVYQNHSETRENVLQKEGAFDLQGSLDLQWDFLYYTTLVYVRATFCGRSCLGSRALFVQSTFKQTFHPCQSCKTCILLNVTFCKICCVD